MKAIYVTGFMGAGKTTIGKQLAEQLQLRVMDTDQMIEEIYGKSITEIFAEDGETTFRMYEKEILKTLPTDNIVITTGGGIVIQKENREWMRENGIVIYLHCEPEEIFRRLAHDNTRPLLKQNKKEEIRRLLLERLPYYKEANITVNTTKLAVQEVVDDIVKRLKSYGKWEY